MAVSQPLDLFLCLLEGARLCVCVCKSRRPIERSFRSYFALHQFSSLSKHELSRTGLVRRARVGIVPKIHPTRDAPHGAAWQASKQSQTFNPTSNAIDNKARPTHSTMVALFSTLLSASSDQDGNNDATTTTTTTTSSAIIPTLVQLFHTSAVTLDANAKLAGHAVLAYQALEVAAPSAEGESTLFGHKRNAKSNVVQNPNLGVWNCRVSPSGGAVPVSDRLVRIPDASSYFCLTVDLSEPSRVETSLTMLQQALERLLIQQQEQSAATDPTAVDGPVDAEIPAHNNKTTSLAKLRRVQFGLANEDKQDEKATDEADEKVKFALMICAIAAPTRNNSKDAYKETQAQNLVLYHLRKFAASLQATLCFVRLSEEKGPAEDSAEDQPAMLVNEFAFAWLEWVLGKTYDSPALYGPDKHQQDDLIESVLLRNASCPGQWDASSDSLWKALPPPDETAAAERTNKPRSVGDEVWLGKLRDSVESANVGAAQTRSPKPEATTPGGAQRDEKEVSDFFKNLLP